MPIPVAQAGPTQAWLASSLPKTVTLAGGATNPPILSWEWTMLSVPPGSTANVGVNGNFTDGVATVQNPSFICDVVGGYVLQLRARNSFGWSLPNKDLDGGQTIIYIETARFQLRLPGYKEYRYDAALNTDLLTLESAIITDHGLLDVTSLTHDDHGQYALLAGRAGGQTLIGGTGTTDKLILQATNNVAAASGSNVVLRVGSSGSLIDALTVAYDGSITVTGTVSGVTPTDPAHLTTKLYVDGLITGLNWKAMVRLASTVAGGNVTLNGDQAIDGFTTTELDRVLLKNQTSPIENGIWIAHTGAAWTRAADMPAGSHASTVTVFVDIGTLNEDVSWFCLTDKPNDIVGTHALSFQVFSNTLSMHNALTGLDGGTSGQYYHLTSAQHTALTNTFTVGMGGTGTSTQFTEGSVVFAGASGVYSQNNAKLTWDNANFRLSITGDLTVTGALGLYSYTAGETLAQYDVVYAYCEAGTSGRLKKATNAAESTSRVVGVVVTGNTAGNAATIVMAGVYKMTFTGTTPAITHFGQPVYLSATAGAVTLTAPGAGTVLLRVGYLVGIGAQAEVSIHIGDEFQQ